MRTTILITFSFLFDLLLVPSHNKLDSRIMYLYHKNKILLTNTQMNFMIYINRSNYID